MVGMAEDDDDNDGNGTIMIFHYRQLATICSSKA